jgi:hypothetical protein
VALRRVGRPAILERVEGDARGRAEEVGGGQFGAEQVFAAGGVREVIEAARRVDIKKRTLQRARKEAKLKTEKVVINGVTGEAAWSLSLCEGRRRAAAARPAERAKPGGEGSG